MRLSPQFSLAVLLASIQCLSACDLQTPWSKEYHLRQFEEWRTLGDRARIRDAYNESRRYYQDALEELEQSQASSVQLASAVQDIAEADLLKVDMPDAVLQYKKALQLYKTSKLSRAEQTSFARCLTGYGLALLNSNRPDNASENFIESARIYKDLSEAKTSKTDKDISVILSCDCLPELCKHANNYWLAFSKQKAKQQSLSKEDLEKLIYDRSACLQSKRLAASSYCANLRQEHNEVKARKIEESLDILPDLSSVETQAAQSKYTIESKKAKIFEQEGNYPAAKAAYIEALRACKETKVACPARTISALYNLAFFYSNVSAWSSALPLLEECLQIQRGRFGDNDRALAIPHSRLARALSALGQLDRADLEARRAYELAVKGYGENNLYTARCEETLGSVEIARKNYFGAEKHLTHSISILSKDPLRNAGMIIDGKINLIEVYHLQGNRAKCLDSAQDAAAYTQEHGTYSDQMRALKNLYFILIEQGKQEQAQDILKQIEQLLEDAASNPKWKNWAKKVTINLGQKKQFGNLSPSFMSVKAP